MDTPLRVLIVEDSDRDVALEVRALEAGGYRVTYAVAETAVEMKAALVKQAFDIVISDHGLPQFDAPGALAVLKQSGLDIPFIVVSGTIGEEAAVALMKAGAHDYVMKDRLFRLASAVERALKDAESLRGRKQAEEALQRKHMMLERTEGIAHVGSWKWEIATDTVTWSDELFRIFQRDPREGAPSFAEHPAFYHPDDMARLRQAVEAAVADGTPYELELRAVRKDGETRVCMARGVAEMAMGGRVGRLFGSLQDITERKLAEETLRESENKYRLLADNVNDVIFVLDMNLNYTYVSPSVKILRGYEPEEVLKQPPLEILTPSSRDLAMRTLSEIIELEKFGRIELLESRMLQLEMRRKDGSTVWTEVKFSFIRDEDQRPVGILGVTRDITERKQTEKTLQETLERLRKAVGATIQVMVSAIERRDPYTAGHQIRSAALASTIATEMGLSQEKIEGIRIAGSIHDIGKLSIPAEILSKPTRLSEIEFSIIKEHAWQGYEILKDVESPWPLAEMVLQHHERMDGSGYPRGLKGEEICLEARILMVADVVEAMASYRPYRPALGIDKALEEIEKNKGILYDNTVAEACLSLFREKGYQLEQG